MYLIPEIFNECKSCFDSMVNEFERGLEQQITSVSKLRLDELYIKLMPLIEALMLYCGRSYLFWKIIGVLPKLLRFHFYVLNFGKGPIWFSHDLVLAIVERCVREECDENLLFKNVSLLATGVPPLNYGAFPKFYGPV